MQRLPTLLVAALLALVCACAEPPDTSPKGKAEGLWELYAEEPSSQAFHSFIYANRDAAKLHGDPHDRIGVRHQVRALEIQSLEAVRVGDGRLGHEVEQRVGEIERGELLDLYEEVFPGARERLLAARERVLPLFESD